MFVNIDEGLGMSIINDEVVTGTSRFFRIRPHEIRKEKELCCKTGCLGTEVSGFALKLDLEEKLKEGIKSNHFNRDKPEYEDIVLAATREISCH